MIKITTIFKRLYKKNIVWNFNRGGIYDDPACDEASIYKMNHAIVIVGYGTDEDDTDYWIVRNSFGTSWGMDGYMFIERGVNKCNIESWAAYVIPA